MLCELDAAHHLFRNGGICSGMAASPFLRNFVATPLQQFDNPQIVVAELYLHGCSFAFIPLH